MRSRRHVHWTLSHAKFTFVQAAFIQGLAESLLGCLPVDNIPDCAEVLSFAVLILEVILLIVSTSQ